MPLVRLETENFKSYRGKQIIGPFYSFSCVIGPNGSGKSNLMDAISFVLGVKSAHLRSSQLKDLIYRGRRLAENEDGSPASDEDDDGAAGAGDGSRASVTAVYRDGKGVEHKFQRSITLSGSSEYRINGKVTPYSHYNSRLEQFNILVKAKNFLVFQGDVEAVASQNSHDLSKLVDQISGSLDLKDEYDAAKAAMDKAIENSTFNFNKRRGINSELKQFREQKGEAERYEKLLEERDEHVRHRLLWRLFHIERGLETQQETSEKINGEIEDLTENAKLEEGKVDAARTAAARVQKDMLKQEKALKRAEAELADVQPEMDAIETRLAYSKRTAANAASLMERVQVDLIKHKSAVEKLEKDRQLAQAAADRAEEDHRRAAEQAGYALSPEDLAEYQELKAIAEARALSERQQLDSLTRSIRVRKEKVKALEGDLQALKAQEERLDADIRQQETTAEIAAQRVAAIDAELQEIRASAAKVSAEREQIRAREVEANAALSEVYNKLLQAGHDQKESEREVRMRETVQTLRNIFPGVRGRVIDLCEPTHSKYAAAIATVLGRNTDAIVVDYERTAIDCIDYLRNQRVGQATFIPLDSIQVKPVNDRLRSIAKGARLAFDVVKYQPGVQRAIQHACGNALVCDDMAVARHICYERKQEVKAVTLDGTVIHKSGLITGGQHGNQSATKRWEERELQALHRQREASMAELKDLQRQKCELGTDDDVVAAMGKLEAELRVVRDEHRGVSTRLQGLRDELRSIRTRKEELQPRLESESSEAARLDQNAANLRAVVEEAEDTVFADFCSRIGVANIRVYELRQEELVRDDRYDAQLKRLHHQLHFESSTVASIEERLVALQRAGERERRKIQAARAEQAALEKKIEGLRQRVEAARPTLQAEYDAARDAYAQAKKEAYLALKRLDTAVKQVASCNDTIEKLAAERTSIYRRCRLEDIDLPLEEGSLEKVPILDDDDDTADYGIVVEFDVLDDDERADGSTTMDEALQERIDHALAEIERMTPNMKATERLDDTETRLADVEQDFETARRDAKRARDQFVQLKKERCDLYNRAYKHIMARIDPIYKELTKGKAAPIGGVAYLSLEDTEEPYLGGIKFHAMPPMKRFRDMDQLSGGEKTIAALALLFAVHSYQPAPFFVLDEVDAALDAHNVAKVSNYIRQHASDAFQFIVISLKPSLYERSQALVGIYRDQEQNSSATLTLDLEAYA